MGGRKNATGKREHYGRKKTCSMGKNHNVRRNEREREL